MFFNLVLTLFTQMLSHKNLCHVERTVIADITGTGKNSFFPVQLTTGRICNLTRLILTLAICATIHSYYPKDIFPSFSTTTSSGKNKYLRREHL